MNLRRAINVLGSPLVVCGQDPMTGYYRNGCCDSGAEDRGVHTVCCVMTSAFLSFSLERGNDLMTPRPEIGFAGLRPGDRWCVCAQRWLEAAEAGYGAPVILEGTHEATLEFVSLEMLLEHAEPIAR